MVLPIFPKLITRRVLGLVSDQLNVIIPNFFPSGDASTAFTDTPHEHGEITPAEYQEWPFQGVAKCIAIGDKRMFHLEFSLPRGLGYASLLMSAVDYGPSKLVSGPLANDQRTRSKMSSPGSKSSGTKWTPEEDENVRSMRRQGFSWDKIQSALPHRSKGTIKVRYSTKLRYWPDPVD